MDNDLNQPVEEAMQTKLLFKVEDTGVGIKQENLKKLFQMFTQLDQQNGVNKSGCGLGLTICKNLTSKMGGSIEVQSIFGVGSIFSFTIKAHTPEPEINQSRNFESQRDLRSYSFLERLSDDVEEEELSPDQNLTSLSSYEVKNMEKVKND